MTNAQLADLLERIAAILRAADDTVLTDGKAAVPARNARPDPPYLTAHQLSERIGIPVHTIRRMHRRGLIPYIDMGKRTKRYVIADVQAALAKHRRKEVY